MVLLNCDRLPNLARPAIASLASLFALVAQPAFTQITPDNTLPTPSSTAQTGATTTITGGTTVGPNLFHSFSQFSVPASATAIFNPAANIRTILTRVTGNQQSQINGFLGVNGTANLFLLNPNGVVFGPNAQLGVSGSFVATTANSFKFSDGQEFSATNPQAPPLLAINVPIGLQFGPTPGAIVQQSPLLAVPQGQTLALIGGDVSLAGGYLSAFGGRVEIGSVQEAGHVGVAADALGFTFSYPNIQSFGAIELSSAAEINTSGVPAGPVHIQGRSLRLSENSRIIAANFGTETGGTLTINASDAIALVGTGNFDQTLQGLTSSTIAPDSVRNAIFTLGVGSGAAGNIVMNTRSLSFQQGTFVASTTLGAGDSGNLSINASDFIELDQGLLFNGTSLGTTGNGGVLTVNTRALTLRDNSEISTVTFGTGRAGSLTIAALDSVQLIGGIPIPVVTTTLNNVLVTGIFTNSVLGAQVGNLELTTGRLTLSDGARIGADNQQGDGGNLMVTATEAIDLRGTSPGTSFPTAISAFGSRRGGNLMLKTPRLTVADRAEISVQSLGEGNAGSLSIVADAVQLNNRASLAATSAIGAGGNIQIESRSLDIAQGSTISAITGAQGDAGNITINSRDRVAIDGATSGLFTTTAAGGRGGAIAIRTDQFSIANFAQLNASTTSTEPGGTITVNSRIFEARSGGRLRTSTLGAGQAGDIQVTASDRATFQGTGILDPALGLLSTAFASGDIAFVPPVNGQGAVIIVQQPTGNVKIPAEDVFRLAENQTGLFASSYNRGAGGNIVLSSPQINIADNTLLSVSAWATGNGGTLRISGDRIAVADSLLLSSTTAGNGGNLSITANALSLNNSSLIAVTARGVGATLNLDIGNVLLLRQQSQITARAFETGTGGNININARFVVAVPSENSDITAGALQGQGGNIRINTQGIYGLAFRSKPTPQSDITASSQFGVDGVVTISSPNLDPDRGLVQLPAELADASRQVVETCAAQATANQFVITGRGGLPQTPKEFINAAPGWSVGEQEIGSTAKDPDSPVLEPISEPIVEATGWIVRSDGTVVLVADTVRRSPPSIAAVSCAQSFSNATPKK
jgi:filamentous hemagglutinin family protein